MDNIAYKVVDHDIDPIESLKNTFPYQTKIKLINGEKLTQKEADYLYAECRHNSYSKRGIPLMGWLFDFSYYLKGYYIEYTYGNIEKAYAINKTAIRNNERDIFKITEI